jgi:hypothetical protein
MERGAMTPTICRPYVSTAQTTRAIRYLPSGLEVAMWPPGYGTAVGDAAYGIHSLVIDPKLGGAKLIRRPYPHTAVLRALL